MTTITPGAGGTLESTTAEAALVELATIIRNAERTSTTNPNNRKYVNVDYNANTFNISITFSVPVSTFINDQGQEVMIAPDYLTGVQFAPGTGGTFKATGITQSFLEICEYLQSKEKNSTSNPTGLNNISKSYDSDTDVYSGTVSIPFLVALESGIPQILVSEYLDTI